MVGFLLRTNILEREPCARSSRIRAIPNPRWVSPLDLLFCLTLNPSQPEILCSKYVFHVQKVASFDQRSKIHTVLTQDKKTL